MQSSLAFLKRPKRRLLKLDVTKQAEVIVCSSGEEQDLKELAILGRKVNGVCACGPFAGKCGDGCGDQCIPVTLWVGICV
ncbi:hypothetical protein H5410_023468 [Solanum commersonii]|uniref:Uncharacterized protein n=1 Tax=Solanum commersonii TaxID=4109 RepID=A0A9J5ZGY9_SOLCO|nr:hypothetical protein H5410_023468 [Solanum commersonii]